MRVSALPLSSLPHLKIIGHTRTVRAMLWGAGAAALRECLWMDRPLTACLWSLSPEAMVGSPWRCTPRGEANMDAQRVGRRAGLSRVGLWEPDRRPDTPRS